MRAGVGRLLLLVLGLGLALLVSEVVLAVLDLPTASTPPRKQPQFRFLTGEEHDPLLGYVNVPSAAIRFDYGTDPRGAFGPESVVVHRTNSRGFRGPEFAARPAEASLRIAFVGDSFTFGEGVRDDEVFPVVAARALSERLSGREVEPVNLGVGGYNAEQVGAMLERRALALEPDAVVLAAVPNDVRAPLSFVWDPKTKTYRRRRREAAAQSSEGPPSRLRSVRLVRSLLESRREERSMLREYRLLFAEGSPRWSRTRRAWDRAGRRCQEAKIPCVALVFPVLRDLHDYPLRTEHERVLRALAGSGFLVVDLLETLRGRDASELWVHPGDHHPNEIVHGIAGERIAEVLAPLCRGGDSCAPAPPAPAGG